MSSYKLNAGHINGTFNVIAELIIGHRRDHQPTESVWGRASFLPVKKAESRINQ